LSPSLAWPLRGWSRRLLVALAAIAFPILSLLALDRLFPLPLQPDPSRFSTVVAAADGTPLRAFADDQGVWRYPVRPEEISPLYLQALLGYEDRWFRYHPGVNPFALARAAWQWAAHGQVVSGGSTLTMQVASLLDPHPRTVAGKLRQCLRALQLEGHLGKDRILALYLDLAPFGGPIEGVEAASFAYLGKPARLLSHAEAALLAVLPQAPSRLRPDRHPEAAEQARNKLLDRLAHFGVWSPRTVAEAKLEHVLPQFHAEPLTAPLLARRLRPELSPEQALATTIDAGLQRSLEGQLGAFAADLPEKTSVAILVVENRGLQVRAYIGSVDFLDEQRFGHVDMVQARRSPGSTLKPFLYGFALEDGIIHSESLLVDAPQSFNGYRPENFADDFSGPVSVREALQRSLNVPAVEVLDRLGPEVLVARLRNGGLPLFLPAGAGPNLSIVLGGAAARLEDLVAAYTSLARRGLSGRLRFTEDQPLRERRMLSEGAAWIVRDILEGVPRPAPGSDAASERRRVAWKTGTSYGFRDAWAIGVADDYTVGVWVGRPDGTPMPGYFGAVTAAPILFHVLDTLPAPSGVRTGRPPSVCSAEICWPLGTEPRSPDDPLCHERRTAWVLNGVVPPTLPDRALQGTEGLLARVWVDSATGLQIPPGCAIAPREPRDIARWPLALEPWLPDDLLAKARAPELDPRCPQAAPADGAVTIRGLEPETTLRRAGADGPPPSVTLSALGARGELYWLVNGKLRRHTGAAEPLRLTFQVPGRYEITAMEPSGRYDRVEVMVMP
jgi:penicillin-binding protein 1C